MKNRGKLHTRISGGFAVLLGLTVMGGWLAGSTLIVQLHPGLVPMQFNTALAFFLCGLSMLFAARSGGARFGAACAAAALLLSFLVGFQYLAGVNFGIDNLFVEPFAQTKTSHPGRMAPNTALCFIIIATALAIWQISKNKENRMNAAIMGGITVCLISVMAIIGYLVKVDAAYSWWGMSDMAPHTAVGMFALSLGLLFLSGTLHRERDPTPLRHWMPRLVIAGGVLATLLIVQSMVASSKHRIENAVRNETSRHAHDIQVGIDRDISLLRRMQERWGELGGIAPEIWQREAARVLRDTPTLYSLALTRQDLGVTAAVFPPDTPDSAAFWHDAQADGRVAEEGKALLIPDTHGGRTALFYLPLQKNGAPDGFLAVAYDLRQTLLRQQNADALSSFRFQMRDENGAFYESAAAGADAAWQIADDADISLLGLHWKLRVIRDISGYENSGLIFMIFIACIGLSLSLAYVMKQANMLQRRDRQYALATEAARIGIWEWDMPGKFLVWGGNAWEILGAKTNEDIPDDEDDVLALIPAEDRDKIRAGVLESIEKNAHFTVDYRTKRLDGREIWVQSCGSVVGWEDGKPARLSGTLTDITLRKDAEEHLQRSNKELEQFAYVASHDLKAPLRGIDNLAQWVVEDMGDALTEDARDKMALLRNRVARLESLLTGILSYSRAGRIVDAPEKLDIGKLVKAVADLNVPEAFTVTAEGLPVLTTSRTSLEQIFGNIFSNAVKHHDKGMGHISVSAEDHGAFYEFTVKDDGPGIPPEFREKVFEMFQTLKPRDKKEGSGLGMSIVRKLVEWQGGNIWIESAGEERGTAVHFLWPRVPKMKKTA